VNLSGIGSLWLDGEQLQPRLKYEVSVTQRGFMHKASGRIVIDPHEAGKLIARLGPNSDLVLLLDDGRRWPCTLRNNHGDLAGRGELG